MSKILVIGACRQIGITLTLALNDHGLKPMLIILLLIAVFAAQAQKKQHPVSIIVNVLDRTSQQTLTEATVLLVKSNETVARQLSQDSGFMFMNVLPGKYKIVTSYTGFLRDTTELTIGKKDTADITLLIKMQPLNASMMEVVVHAQIPPAIIRNDTIAFSAGAYPSPPNATLEDLLKKLPGFEVDGSGNVTMQGQKVDKIYIDGKEFFLNDLKSATQNIPSDLIAQVEAFDTESEKSKRTGIKEKAGSKTIDIKLKKNRKIGLYGKVYSGGAINDSYSAGGNITRLAPFSWLFANLNTNDINNQFTGTDHQTGAGAGVQRFQHAALNYRENRTSKLTASFNGSFDKTNSTQRTITNKQTALVDSSILENDMAATQNKSTSINGSAFLEYKFDSLEAIQFRSNYSDQNSTNQSSDTVTILTIKPDYNYLLSRGKVGNQNNTYNSSITNSLDFSKRFAKQGRTLYAMVTQSASWQQQPATLYLLLNTFDSTGAVFQTVLLNQQSVAPTQTSGYGANIAYTEPVGKHHVIDFNVWENYSSSHSDKQSFDYDSLTGKYDNPDGLTSNNFLNQNNVQRIDAGYNTTEGKCRFQVGLTTQFTQLDNTNLITGIKFSENSVNWYPRASLLWEISKQKNIDIFYSGSGTPPSIEQLQPVPDFTNPYLIKLGNPHLKQQLTHSLSAAYIDFNTQRLQNWQVMLNGDFAQNDITSSSTLLAGGLQQIQYINVSGVYHVSSYVTYGLPIPGKKGNFSFSFHTSYGHDISGINAELNTSANFGMGGAVNIDCHFGNKLFADLNAGIDDHHISYSSSPSSNTAILKEKLGFDLNYQLPDQFTVTTYYDIQVTGSQGTLPAQTVLLWNASVYKNFLENHSLQLRLSAFDLLNKASNFSQSIGVNYVQTQQTNLPGRLLLLSVIYHFRKFTS